MELTARSGVATVELVYIGEGYNGDYDPSNPADEPLYRADVTLLDEEDETGSYCTSIVMDVAGVDYAELAQKAADHAAELARQGMSAEKIAARLSWWTITDQTSPFDEAPGGQST